MEEADLWWEQGLDHLHNRNGLPYTMLSVSEVWMLGAVPPVTPIGIVDWYGVDHRNQQWLKYTGWL